MAAPATRFGDQDTTGQREVGETASLGNGASAQDALVEAFVRERFVDMFLSQNHRAQAGLFAAAAVVAFVWFERTRSASALWWIVGAAIVTVARYRHTERFVRGDAVHATGRIASVLLVNGILMAVPLLAFDDLSELERAAVSIVLLASATASVATTSGYRAVFLAFAVPMLVPLAGAWVLTASAEEVTKAPLGIGVLVLLFLLFLVSIGRQAHQVFEESSRFRYGEQTLTRSLQLALEQASEANRAKTRFLAAASHDLRQPIHSMTVLVAALNLRELDDRSHEIATLLEMVNQSLSRQLDGLLDISKLDAGAIEPVLAVHRLDDLAAAHHAATLPLARERGIALELDLAGEPSVLTDATLLMRVLGNLTANALKFTDRGGTVRLLVRQEAGLAVLAVSDTGIGIDPQEHERIFQEFYQVGNVERDRSKGLGLGLSIVRRMCRLLAVELDLASRPGQGTSVSLRLPLAAPRHGAPVQLASVPVARGLVVLVVDDEPLVRRSMRLLLTELGCVVHLAEGLEQAGRLAAAQRVDAVLSDFRLRDGESGLQVLSTVLALHPLARAALVTGDTAPDRIRDAARAGVPLLHKPVTLVDLLNVLQPSAATGAKAMEHNA